MILEISCCVGLLLKDGENSPYLLCSTVHFSSMQTDCRQPKMSLDTKITMQRWIASDNLMTLTVRCTTSRRNRHRQGKHLTVTQKNTTLLSAPA